MQSKYTDEKGEDTSVYEERWSMLIEQTYMKHTSYVHFGVET